jgi:hypothetical protein
MARGAMGERSMTRTQSGKMIDQSWFGPMILASRVTLDNRSPTQAS